MKKAVVKKTEPVAYALLVKSLIFILSLYPISLLADTNPSFWKSVEPKSDSIISLLENSKKGTEEARALLQELKYLADLSGNPTIKSRYYYWDAYINSTERYGVEDKYYPQLYEALRLLDTAKYKYDYARITYLMINPLRLKESYVDQYKIYLELLPIVQQTGDELFEATIYRRLGILLSELNKFDLALEYMQNANIIYSQLDRKDLMTTNMVNLSIVYQNMGKTDSATQLLDSLLNQRETYIDTTVLTAIYNNYFVLAKDLTLKEQYARKAYNTNKQFKKDKYALALAQQNLASIFQEKNQLDSALLFYQAAYNYAFQTQTTRIILPALSGITQVYKRQGDFKNAFSYFEKYQSFKDSIAKEDITLEINRIQAETEIQKYRDRLIIELQHNQLRKKQHTIYILVSIGVLLTLIFIVIFISQKRKITENKLIKEELDNKNLRKKIDLQNRELSTSSLLANEKNLILNNILNHIKVAYANKEISREFEVSLRKLILDNLHAEEEWETFKLHFEKVHPNFFINLKREYPELTENDLKLCAYLRIGLSPKQISQILSVLPATIKTNRYLLRKKFNLDKDYSLDDFIRQYQNNN